MRPSPRTIAAVVLAAALASSAGCYDVRPSAGGGQTEAPAQRTLKPADIALPEGYRIEAVASGLTFPTGVAFDDAGVAHVVEAGYSYGEAFTIPRLLRIANDGTITEVARGGKNGPWTGVAYANGAFYVAEGGQLEGGRVLRIDREGKISVLIEKLPSFGDHHTNGPAIGPDGTIYFGQGAATNSGIVGEDNKQFGWLKRFPKFHDIPCQDITVSGVNVETEDVLGGTNAKVRTGAFVPFGTQTTPGQVIKGQVPCSGAIMRLSPNGGAPEVIAWGLRNPFGLAFAPDGALYVTENGYDDRGSRPVWGAPDVLWRISPGTWYGWPDYAEGLPVTLDAFKPPKKERPQKLLAKPVSNPPRPVAVLGVHASSNGLDFSRSSTFGFTGQAFIAEFGDQSPVTGKSLHPVGFRVIRVDVSNGRIEDFAVNRGKHNGPATKLGTGGLERPVGLRFNPAGDALYVVDFGVMLMDNQGAKPQQKTGVLWRITRAGAK
jgi:glucose/arabinose dehydrogenase